MAAEVGDYDVDRIGDKPARSRSYPVGLSVGLLSPLRACRLQEALLNRDRSDLFVALEKSIFQLLTDSSMPTLITEWPGKCLLPSNSCSDMRYISWLLSMQVTEEAP